MVSWVENAVGAEPARESQSDRPGQINTVDIRDCLPGGRARKERAAT